MPKYVRFEKEEDVQWLVNLLGRALAKMKTDTSMINDENVEIIPRIYDAVLQAGDIEAAEAMGVPAKDLQEDKKAAAEKKASRKKRKPSNKRAGVKTVRVCNTHPTYGAVRRPSHDCETCWKEYKKMHPLQYANARRAFERKQSKIAGEE